MTAAEELRAAATRLREACDEATPGPWSVGNGEVIGLGIEQTGRGSFTYEALLARVIDDDEREEDNYRDRPLGSTEGDANWIALVSPAVAEPFAVLLDLMAGMAEYAEEHGYRTAVEVEAALKVARSIPGAPASPVSEAPGTRIEATETNA